MKEQDLVRLKGVLMGTLLGDAWIGAKIGVRFEHSIEQEEYVMYKTSLISAISGTECRMYRRDAREPVIDGERVINSQPTIMGMYSNADLCRTLDSLMYNADRVKYITNTLMEQLTPEGLALWYFDDGCFNYSQIVSNIATYAFNICDHNIMKEHLDSKFGLTANIAQKKDNHRGTNTYYLYFNRENTLKLFDIIECALNDIPLSMRYKIPIEWRKIEYASDYKWMRLTKEQTDTKKRELIRLNLQKFHKEIDKVNPQPADYFNILGYKSWSDSYSISKAIRSVYGSVEQALLQSALPTKLC